MKNIRFLRATSLLVLLCVALSACGTRNAISKDDKADATAGKDAKQPADMTRPPVTIGAEREIVVESNPDETISFEEWKRRQESGASSDQEADAQAEPE